MSIDQHNSEIQRNKKAWDGKPLLRLIYSIFYKEILGFLNTNLPGAVVEIGSGVGNFKSVYPKAVATDIFPNPWIDRVESAYSLSYDNLSVSNLVLFDVFHHLAFPGSALKEFSRVLVQKGRVIIFEPYVSVLGFLVYGLFHHEPIAIGKKINWEKLDGVNPDNDYYAAQGNAMRVFGGNSDFKEKIFLDWNIVSIKKYSAISYVLSGGFSKPSLYPEKLLPLIRKIEKFLDMFPYIFATRMLVVLEKK